MTARSTDRGEAYGAATQLVRIADAIDVFVARWAIQRIAKEIGFAPTAGKELAIVVSELTTNILKYGVRGEIRLRRVDDPRHGPGVEIVAADIGPPIADLTLALRDGHGDRGPIDPARWVGRGGIGAGLGAVVRLTDSFEYGVGAAEKWFRVVRHVQRPRSPNPL